MDSLTTFAWKLKVAHAPHRIKEGSVDRCEPDDMEKERHTIFLNTLSWTLDGVVEYQKYIDDLINNHHGSPGRDLSYNRGSKGSLSEIMAF
ncbi:hypothetical protein N7532_002410 [Penicillium argentinense]|uniref:Uncharacterized protein n=1 Tax=Penicillium argentinense TaxID=1131581 RepID=A0A9W9G0B8_9EURO|nr:uncharacterized protein N7532_002410 [Penicillium argentinense]KAJ5109765.1 hypothetical protein N7532_002410 [Penicillium argentinense]